MRKGDAEVKNKMTRAEKAEMRRAIRRERRGQNKTGVASVTDEAKSFGRGLGRVVSGYDFVVVVLVVLLSLFGIAMVFSAGYYQTINSADPNPTYYLFRQALWVQLSSCSEVSDCLQLLSLRVQRSAARREDWV